MSDSPRRQYFKSADEFRTKARNPDFEKWDAAIGNQELDAPSGEAPIASSDSDRLSGVFEILKEWEKRLPVRHKATTDDSGSVVYFIKAGNVVKIGIAANADKRLRELQTANPHRLELLGTITGGRSKEMELHERFHHLRLSGEWFTASAELLEYVAALISMQGTPHER